MNRRTVLYGGVAVAAAAAGAGVAWWTSRPGPGIASGAPVAGKPGQAGGAADPFWSMSFDTPEGKNLPVSGFRGKPLLVNFWATWCPPCIEELPLLDAFYQANRAKGWQVLGLAVDQPSAVRKWLEAKPLNFPVGMAGLSGTELSKSLGNLAGSLPFSIVFGATGDVLHRKIGKVTAEDLRIWLELK